MATKKPDPPKVPAAPAKKVPAPKPAPPKKPAPPPVDDEPVDLPKPPPEEKPDTPPPAEASTPAPAPKPSTPDKPDANGIDREKLVAFIEDIIDTLTFKRIGLVALLVVIGLAIFSFYENRVAIVDKLIHIEAPENLPAITSWTLSDKSKKAMEDFTKNSVVTFISVTDVDLRKNRRSVKFFFVDDPKSYPLSVDAQRAIALPQAVFDYDPKNTAQMVAVLSNEFRCDPYQDTINYRFAPEYKDRIPTVCRIAIPPFVGQFVGILTVGISPSTPGGTVTKQDTDAVRLELSRIAVDIYLNDVIKKQESSGPDRN